MNYEPTWKLGNGFNDMNVHDNMLDGFTIQDVIDAVHANCPVKDENAVRKTVQEMIEQRMEDLKTILDNNAAIIAKLAMPAEERKEEKEHPAIPADQIELLAKDICDWCHENKFWADIYIYYNGKRMGTSGWINGKEVFRYNGEPFIEDGYDPHTCFEYAGPTLSMSFEGTLYEELNYGDGKKYRELQDIFDSYGLYFEFGDAWNLSAFKV